MKQELKVFVRYADERVCTVNGNPLEYIEYANSLHKNIEFTLETTNADGELSLPDLNINVNYERPISCNWHNSSTDTGIHLSFRKCALLQHEKNMFQGIAHNILNKTNDWWQAKSGDLD